MCRSVVLDRTANTPIKSLISGVFAPDSTPNTLNILILHVFPLLAFTNKSKHGFFGDDEGSR